MISTRLSLLAIDEKVKERKKYRWSQHFLGKHHYWLGLLVRSPPQRGQGASRLSAAETRNSATA